MSNAIVNTSPLVYLHRIGALDWLAKLFGEVWVPSAVVSELEEGQRKGYDVPEPRNYSWLKVVAPRVIPSEWLTLDLGAGEIAAMALALENPSRIAVLDDARARQIAQAAGLTVWGTLKVLLEAKSLGLTEKIEPHVNRLAETGMWISDDIRKRILALAGEKG